MGQTVLAVVGPGEGKSVTVQVVDVVTVRDGKAVSEREYYDQLGMMQQLGVIPSP
jgi:ketosteroid isomerase-like protein